jgi:hypothetical protein
LKQGKKKKLKRTRSLAMRVEGGRGEENYLTHFLFLFLMSGG